MGLGQCHCSAVGVRVNSLGTVGEEGNVRQTLWEGRLASHEHFVVDSE